METKEEAQALIGHVLDGKYRLEALIGRGGFGVVYRARHLIWEQPVAIKVLTKLTNVDEAMRDEVLGFFVREGRLLSALSSRTTGIVQARDIGTMVTEGGLWMPYMVLEWLEGEPLGRILKRERWAGGVQRGAGEVFQIFDGVARALAVAHANNVAHRDIKPPNLVVLGGRLEPGAVIKLLDFGIAKVMQTHAGQALAMTTSKESIFTPYYGAPEQYDRSLGASGPWTDVFAMALVLVELMIGRRVFNGQDFAELSRMCLDPDARPTPRSLGAEVDGAVEAVFAEALAIRVEDRFRTMGDFWLALVEALRIEGYPPLPIEAIAEVEGAPSSAERSSAALSASQLRAGESLESLRALDSQSRELGQSWTDPQGSIQAQAAERAESAERAERAERAGAKGRRGVVLGAGLLLVGGGLVYLGVDGDADATAVEDSSETVEPATPAVAGSSEACPTGMVRIEGSSYFMGSDAEDVPALALARPAHKVEVGDFCLDRTEVTVAAYRALSEVGECKRAYADAFWPRGEAEEEEEWRRLRAAYSPLCNGVDAGRDDHPVNCVTWSQADEYCRIVGKRLPTEAEWELAARGRDGRVFPWGDEPPTADRINGCGLECRAWSEAAGLEVTPTLYASDDGYAGTSPVGSFPKGRTEAGLVDMIGNVFEWTADAYRPYDQESAGDPSRRVIRGGAFNSFQAEHADPALRYPMAAEAHSHGIGFRCAASPAGEGPAGDRDLAVSKVPGDGASERAASSASSSRSSGSRSPGGGGSSP